MFSIYSLLLNYIFYMYIFFLLCFSLVSVFVLCCSVLHVHALHVWLFTHCCFTFQGTQACALYYAHAYHFSARILRILYYYMPIRHVSRLVLVLCLHFCIYPIKNLLVRCLIETHRIFDTSNIRHRKVSFGTTLIINRGVTNKTDLFRVSIIRNFDCFIETSKISTNINF